MKRRALIGLAVLALLVGLYAAAGYWVAPGYVRQALTGLAAQRGLTLELSRVHTRPFSLRVELAGIALRGPDGALLAQAERASADLAWSSLWRRDWIMEEVRIAAPAVPLGKLPPVKGAAPSGNAGTAAVTIRHLIVEDGTLRYAPRNLALEALTLHARDLSTLDAAAGSYEASARLAGGAGQLASKGSVALAPLAAEGTLSVTALRVERLLPRAQGQLTGSARYVYAGADFALRDVSIEGGGLAYDGHELPRARLRAAQGRVQLAPFAISLNLDAEALPLALAQLWLPEGVTLRIVSGAVSGTGLLDLGPQRASYQGSAAIRDLRLEERGSGALLLAWREAETASLAFASSPLTISAGELLVRAPEGRLVIEEDGAVNFAALFPPREENGEPLRASVERLRIEQGTLHFADRSLETPFEATIGELAGAVTGMTLGEGPPARVRLNGRVQRYGTARIRGTIDLDAPANLADIRATFRNLPLEAFNPYVVKFAGYRIESGRLSAELRYQVREGRLVGTNRLAFDNIQLGEKLEDRGLLDVPLDLAVALLADSKGRIDLDIPVRGNLNDPQFDLGAIVARAFGNVLKNIASAPFRALAALFGDKGSDGPGSVAFAPGSAELSPPAEESVARLAQALAQRPQLGVEVRGGYDPARDLEALRKRAARQELARAAGVRGAPAAAMPLDEGAAQALARARAETVRGALIEQGVGPARVRVGEALEKPADEQGVATELALAAGFAAEAAAGASQPEPARANADPVREAQRRLNAAGFDAGPVDGIFGPRTKRALILYQAAEGLKLTGELDPATRKRLLPG